MGAIFQPPLTPTQNSIKEKKIELANKNTTALCGTFLGQKKRLRQRTHKLGACRNPGAMFLACGNVPTSWWLAEIWGPFFWEKNACGNVVSR